MKNTKSLAPVLTSPFQFYLGREFAHFHNDNELDLQLTETVIQTEGLPHPSGSIHHPTRSLSSPWIEVRFTTPEDIAPVATRVKLAVANR